MTFLDIDDLHVRVEDRPILNGLSLAMNAGEIHAIMGPNGSGKSTLANVLAGHPGYEITGGSIRFRGLDLNGLAPEERAHAGVFMAFQHPVEIPGVTNMEFLKAANDSSLAARNREPSSALEFMKKVRNLAQSLELNAEFLKRGVNEGFSGGERKRNEILQLLLLEPRLAVLDETDSGLDIDALQTVADGINRYHADSNGVLLITHYQRLLNHVVPDHVHVLADGRIVESGDGSLAHALEERGYAWLREEREDLSRPGAKAAECRIGPLHNLDPRMRELDSLGTPPSWLAADTVARSQAALAGGLARETWKYSSLTKTLRTLIGAPSAARAPLADVPEGVSVNRLSALARPPALALDIERYPLAGITASLAGDGWLIDVKRSPDRPLDARGRDRDQCAGDPAGAPGLPGRGSGIRLRGRCPGSRESAAGSRRQQRALGAGGTRRRQRAVVAAQGGACRTTPAWNCTSMPRAPSSAASTPM